MGYKWKPSKTQKEDYIRKCKERDSLKIIQSNGAIRNGCSLTFYSLNKGKVIKGIVVNHSYGKDKNQHTFTILQDNNEKLLVKGRNLYPNLIEHIPGIESLNN